MADFCWQDTLEVFGEEWVEKNDMKGLCGPDEMVGVLCESCGWTYVDSEGKCLGCPWHPIYGPMTLEEEYWMLGAETVHLQAHVGLSW